MSRHDTRTLLLLLERTQAERDAALADAHRAQMAAGRQRAQAAQLQTYRVEYQQRWTTQFGREGRPEIVQCYRSFMDRLDDAVRQQDVLLAQAEIAAEQAQALVVWRERRVGAVRKLIDRRLAEAQLLTTRRDQRASDELAQRHSQRGPLGSGQRVQ